MITLLFQMLLIWHFAENQREFLPLRKFPSTFLVLVCLLQWVLYMFVFGLLGLSFCIGLLEFLEKRWSWRAIKSFAMGELEARKLKYPTTGTEALLMGILIEGEHVFELYLNLFIYFNYLIYEFILMAFSMILIYSLQKVDSYNCYYYCYKV